jgi:hypothetical protein
MRTRSVHTARTQWTSAVSVSVSCSTAVMTGDCTVCVGRCRNQTQHSASSQSLTVLHCKLAFRQRTWMSVCLSVDTFPDCQWRTECCTDFSEAVATFQTLYCTVSRNTCTAFLATIFLKLTAQQQYVQPLIPNFTQFVKWMWEVRTKSPLRTWVKRDFYSFDFHETRVRWIHFIWYSLYRISPKSLKKYWSSGYKCI